MEGPEYLAGVDSGYCWFCLACAACAACEVVSWAFLSTGYVGSNTC